MKKLHSWQCCKKRCRDLPQMVTP